MTKTIKRLLRAGAVGMVLIDTMTGDGRRRVLADGRKAQAAAKEHQQCEQQDADRTPAEFEHDAIVVDEMDLIVKAKRAQDIAPDQALQCGGIA
ncbi:hypothetical protein [Chitinibacter sp. S2-10]|uniref:hypothetical protein n=1 Tax=Chitinibacter sp. S2-10 TaxID=3373597 RepID=UPI0039778FA8